MLAGNADGDWFDEVPARDRDLVRELHRQLVLTDDSIALHYRDLLTATESRPAVLNVSRAAAGPHGVHALAKLLHGDVLAFLLLSPLPEDVRGAVFDGWDSSSAALFVAAGNGTSGGMVASMLSGMSVADVKDLRRVLGMLTHLSDDEAVGFVHVVAGLPTNETRQGLLRTVADLQPQRRAELLTELGDHPAQSVVAASRLATGGANAADELLAEWAAADEQEFAARWGAGYTGTQPAREQLRQETQYKVQAGLRAVDRALREIQRREEDFRAAPQFEQKKGEGKDAFQKRRESDLRAWLATSPAFQGGVIEDELARGILPPAVDGLFHLLAQRKVDDGAVGEYSAALERAAVATRTIVANGIEAPGVRALRAAQRSAFNVMLGTISGLPGVGGTAAALADVPRQVGIQERSGRRKLSERLHEARARPEGKPDRIVLIEFLADPAAPGMDLENGVVRQASTALQAKLLSRHPDVPVTRHTAFGVAGAGQNDVEVEDDDKLRSALRACTSRSRIVILGHTDLTLRSPTFAGLSAREVALSLDAYGLPPDAHARIKVESCGRPPGGDPAWELFVAKLHRALAAYGRLTTVTGYTREIVVGQGGRTFQLLTDVEKLATGGEESSYKIPDAKTIANTTVGRLGGYPTTDVHTADMPRPGWAGSSP